MMTGTSTTDSSAKTLQEDVDGGDDEQQPPGPGGGEAQHVRRLDAVDRLRVGSVDRGTPGTAGAAARAPAAADHGPTVTVTG